MVKKALTADGAAVAAVRQAEGRDALSREIVSARGYKLVLRPVPPFLVDKAMSLVPEPQAPIWHNEQTGRDEENRADPTYLRDMRDAREQRAEAAVNAMMLMGVELADGIPDDGWEKRVAVVGIEVDTTDPLMRELAYKKYIVMAQEDLDAVTALSNVRREAIEEAKANFPGGEA